MNTLLKHTLTASILSTMMASTAFAAPSEAPPAFVKESGIRLDLLLFKVDSRQNYKITRAGVKAIVRQKFFKFCTLIRKHSHVSGDGQLDATESI